MTKPQKLTLTQAQFEALHLALDGTRSTSTTVRVDREALKNILHDHSKMSHCLKVEV